MDHARPESPMTQTVMAERLAEVRARMAEAARRSGRSPEAVRLVAVSKFHPAEAVRLAALCGQVAFGENYVQEALAKQDELAALNLEWHAIGHLQTNKARDVAGRFSLIHGVDSERLARAIAARVPAAAAPQAVLVQINIGDEPQKAGVAEADAPAVLEAVLSEPALALKGLMGMPPFFDQPEAARPFFVRLRKLRDTLEVRFGVPLPELSMGMSGDFEAAIEEGATIVRVGTTIFGARPTK